MTPTLGVYGAILLAGAATTYVWRWIGVVAAARLDPDSEILVWVRAVATALVAALVARIVLAPPDLLAITSLQSRLIAIVIGTGASYLAKRNVGLGVAAAVTTLYLAQIAKL